VFSRFHARSGALGVKSDRVERDWRKEDEVEEGWIPKASWSECKICGMAGGKGPGAK
jgi:hypothetical protein